MIRSPTDPPSLADVLLAVEQAEHLSAERQRDLRSAVHRIADILATSPEHLPASLPALRPRLQKIAPAAHGIGKKTWQNLRSNLLAAVHLAVPRGQRRRTRSSPEWKRLHELLPSKRMRNALSRFLTWCDREGIEPTHVSDAVVDRFAQQLIEGTLVAKPQDLHRRTSRVWNEALPLPGWPQIRLTLPDYQKPRRTVRLDDLPQSFQDELQAHLAWLSGADLFCDRPPPTVCKPSTVELRRDNVRLAASALAATGVDPASIRGLADLVTRDRVKTILLFYIDKAERQVTAFTRGLATALLSIAEHWVRVSPEELADLKSLRQRLGNTALGLTPKNQATLRELSAPAVRHRLLALPQMLLQQGKSNRPTPERAAVTVQLAVAIDILIHAPMRMQNLIGLQLDAHLVRPGGPRGLWHIVLPRHEVKNGEALEYELPSTTTRLVDMYLRQFRPALAPDGSRHLFVVAGGAPKSQTTLAQQIKGAILEHVGIVMTPHQFRHFAAKLMLEHSPGAHGATSHLLGHRNLKTTVAFYSGLDSLSAGRQFDAILQREQAQAVPPRRRLKRVRSSPGPGEKS